MSVFHDLEDSAATLEVAQQQAKLAGENYKGALSKVEPFRLKACHEIQEVLTAFRNDDLLAGIVPSHHDEQVLYRYYHQQVSPQAIPMLSESAPHADGENGKEGFALTQAIVQIAQAKHIPVTHGTEVRNTLEVSPEVERERCPELLLRALAAYAEFREKPKSAELAAAAADRVAAMVADLNALPQEPPTREELTRRGRTDNPRVADLNSSARSP